jgi:hypothetical protein
VPGRNGQAQERFRSKGTANAITGTVFRFLRFCSLLDDSPVPADVAARLYEPRYLAFAPPGYDRGEDGQYAVVNVKTVRFKVAVSGCEYLTDDEIRAILDLTTRARDRLLVALMAVTGCRIGEALGLRREDMHLLSSSRLLGCPVEGRTFTSGAGRTPTGRWPRPASPAGSRSATTSAAFTPATSGNGTGSPGRRAATWSSSTSSRRRPERR